AEAMASPVARHAKARLAIQTPSRVELTVRPERNAPVACLPGKGDAFGHQARADPEATRRRLDEKETQLGDGLRLFDEEHRSDDFTAAFGHPAALALRIEVLDERRHDRRDQRLEPFVVAVFVRIENAVAMNHPAHIARPVRPEDEGLL